MTWPSWSATEWTAVIASGAAALQAVSSIVSRGRWSKEFAAAKDEIIRSKEAEIAALKEQLAGLKEMMSPKTGEYFAHTRTTLENFIGALQQQLSDAEDRKNGLTAKVKDLEDSGQAQARAVADLTSQKADIEKRADDLEAQLGRLEASHTSAFSSKLVFEVVQSSTALSDSLNLNRLIGAERTENRDSQDVIIKAVKILADRLGSRYEPWPIQIEAVDEARLSTPVAPRPVAPPRDIDEGDRLKECPKCGADVVAKNRFVGHSRTSGEKETSDPFWSAGCANGHAFLYYVNSDRLIQY